MGCVRLAVDRNRPIETSNYSHFVKPIVHPDRRMGVHDIILLIKGSWEIREEGSAFLLKPGDVIFLSAGRHHDGISGCQRGTRTLWIHAGAEPHDAFLAVDQIPPNTETAVYVNPVVSTGGDIRVYTLFESIIRAFWSSLATKRAMSRVLLSELLIELSARSHAAPDSSVTAIDHIIDYIEKDPHQFFTIDALASRVGINRRTLTTHFRKRTGDSIHGYQTKLKIRMAAATFDHIPETPVKQLAHMFGFHDEFHFSKTFKRLMGTSPQQYKFRFKRR